MHKRYGHREPAYDESGTYVPSDYFMDIAIDLGKLCPQEGQHPVGAVVTGVVDFVNADEGGTKPLEVVLGTGANMVHHQSTRHAEIVALGDAEMHHGRRQLGRTCSVLYTTHEPCPMCAGAVANSKIAGIVYGSGADDAERLVNEHGMKWRSNNISGLDIIRGRSENGSNYQFIIGGFKRDECLSLLAMSLLVAPKETGVDIRRSHYMS